MQPITPTTSDGRCLRSRRISLGRPHYALLGVVAYRAGVYQYDIGLFGTVGIDIAVLLHYRDDDLGIADIHLTAVGLYEQLRPAPVSGRSVFTVIAESIVKNK